MTKSSVKARLRLNAICPYYTMFPVRFPLNHLRGVSKGSWILDPFCGRGTTAFAARSRNYPSVSTDTNPVAVAIAAAKVVDVSPYAIVERAKEIVNYGRQDRSPNGEFWEYAFHPAVFKKLLQLRHALKNSDAPADVALRATVLGALHGPSNEVVPSYLSNQMPRTFASKPDYSVRYWKEHRLSPKNVDVIKIIEARAERYFRAKPRRTAAFVLRSDARKIPDIGVRFSMTITSPPYFGMNTYVPDQWLRAWFLGGLPRVAYGQIDQLSRGNVDTFTEQLALVWKRVAELSMPGAKLIIRFGAISSVKSRPREIIRGSLAAARAGWNVSYIRSAGRAEGRHRQANHMGKRAGKVDATSEIDVVCELK